MDVIISSKYKILKLIGEGSFGKIFEVKNLLTNELLAIKIEKKNDKNLLKYEANIYTRCKGLKGFPQLRTFGTEATYNYLVIDLLGEPISQLREKCGGKLKLQTVLIIGTQILNRLENLHELGIIHRDLKPDNILIGKGNLSKTFYLIDLGLARFYIDGSGNHKPIVFDKKLIGTLKYASVNILNGIEASRRDDLISLGYILLNCYNGFLPWQSNKIDSSLTEQSEKIEFIKKTKREIQLIELCKEMPYEFLVYMDYCSNLEYDEKPNYEYLRTLFLNLFKMKKYDANSEYEWNVFNL
jgi:serine/threonine protein kinase